MTDTHTLLKNSKNWDSEPPNVSLNVSSAPVTAKDLLTKYDCVRVAAMRVTTGKIATHDMRTA